MTVEQLADATVSMMHRLMSSGDVEARDESLRLVQQSTRLIEAVGVKRTEVRHVHVDASGDPLTNGVVGGPSPA